MLKNRINSAKNHGVMLGQVNVQSETRGILLENVYKIEDCHGLIIQIGKKHSSHVQAESLWLVITWPENDWGKNGVT